MCLVGCNRQEPVEILDLTFTELAHQILDTNGVVRTDTIWLAGTWAVKPSDNRRYTVAGYKIPNKKTEDSYSSPALDFMFYSKERLDYLAQRIESGEEGASMEQKPLLDDQGTDEQLIALGANPQLIGVLLSLGSDELTEQVLAAIENQLGSGLKVEYPYNGTLWQLDQHVVLAAIEFNQFYFMSPQQMWNNCINFGQAVIQEVGDCDIEGFTAAFPYSIRQDPQ